MPQQSSKKIIMASGVFDLLHPGHIYYLEQSKLLGDELVVIVTNDQVASRTKGETLFDAESRRHMVAALACVDRVVIPTETEPARYYRTVLALNPAIITLGHDQSFSEEELLAELRKYGWQGEIVRVGKLPGEEVSSTLLKRQLKKETT